MFSETKKTNKDTHREAALWSVWREDDNSNSFLIKDNLLKNEASQLVKDYEAKGHKQTYYIKKQPI